MLKESFKMFREIFKDKEFKILALLWFIVITALFLISIVIAFWTQSNINWLLHVTGSEKEIGFWLSWLATIFANAAAIPLNILMEIIKLFF